MDAQLKKGLIDICVLAILRQEKSYGYKLVGDINKHIPISESTLYPILRRLEAMNCITVYSEEHNGRLRKYYSITKQGISRIKDFLDNWDNFLKILNFIKKGEEDDKK